MAIFGANTMVRELVNWNAEHAGSRIGLTVRMTPPEVLEHRGQIELYESLCPARCQVCRPSWVDA
jgi:hypothetical protein